MTAGFVQVHSLVINPDKTKLLVIGVPQIARNLPYFPPVGLLGKEIKPVSVSNCMPTSFPEFSPTRENPGNEVDCMHRLIRINRIKHLPDRKTLLLLINAFVFRKLLYYSTVWSNTSKTNLKRLQLVQNFAGRIVLGLPKYDHISEGLKSLRRLPIADKWSIYKYLKGRPPDYLSQKFTRRLAHHDRNTRYKTDLNLPRCRLKTGQRSFAVRGATCWKRLPNNWKMFFTLYNRAPNSACQTWEMKYISYQPPMHLRFFSIQTLFQHEYNFKML